MLPNGNVMAVKQIFAKSNQDVDEVLNEVVLLTGMRHRNLVNLKGCCIREQHRLLVYEYLVNNCDIDKALLGEDTSDKHYKTWHAELAARERQGHLLKRKAAEAHTVGKKKLLKLEKEEPALKTTTTGIASLSLLDGSVPVAAPKEASLAEAASSSDVEVVKGEINPLLPRRPHSSRRSRLTSNNS